MAKIKMMIKLPYGEEPITRPVKRTCPKCGAWGIYEFQNTEGYNKAAGEVIPQSCPSCGEWLDQSHWGNVKTYWKEVNA